MFVDNSFAKNNVERKEKIYINSVAIVVGAVNMWNSPDSPENTGVQTPSEWLKRLCKTVRNRLDNFWIIHSPEMEQNVGKVIHRFSTTFPREIVEETYCGLIFFIKISTVLRSDSFFSISAAILS